MTEIRSRRLKKKIKRLIGNLGLVPTDQGYTYLCAVIFELINDESLNILEAQEKAAKKEAVPLYELQVDIDYAIAALNKISLMELRKASEYDLESAHENIELIVDSIKGKK